jgi:hypothetical protein
MGSPNDFPFEGVYFEDEDLAQESARSRPRADSNELAIHVAELANQIAELTEAIRVLASRAAPASPAPSPVEPVVTELSRPRRLEHEQDFTTPEPMPAPRMRAVGPASAEPPARPRFDDSNWPSDSEVSQFARGQLDRDEGAW